MSSLIIRVKNSELWVVEIQRSGFWLQNVTQKQSNECHWRLLFYFWYLLFSLKCTGWIFFFFLLRTSLNIGLQQLYDVSALQLNKQNAFVSKEAQPLICVQASLYPLNGLSKANREPPSRKVLLVPTSRGIMAKVVVFSVKEEMHQKGEEGGRPCPDLFPTWQQEERIRKRSRASAAAEHARQQFIRKQLSHLQHIKDVTQE